MSARIHPDMRSAVYARLPDIAGLPPVAYEGVGFSPEIGSPYVGVQMVALGDAPISNGITRHEVLFVATLFYPAGDGTLDLEMMAGAVAQAFKVNTLLTYETAEVRCMRADRDRIITGTAWVQTAVKVRLQADTLD